MNTTKWLCENFDQYDKGYVTIGDVFKFVPLVISVLFCIGYYIYGMYEWLFIDYVIVGPITLLNVFNDFAFMWAHCLTFLGSVIIGCLILVWIYKSIEDVKVVSCKKDEKDK